MPEHRETEQHINEWSVGPWTNKGGNRMVLESSENGSITYQNCKGSAKGKVYSYECLH
jgi:hypothetical protein